MPLPMLLALLLIALCTAAQEQFDAQSLIQVKPGTPPSNEGSFSHWQSTQVTDQPADPPEAKSRPTCITSSMTGTCLPHFMVIGTQKSATSSLWNILRTHPQIKPAEQKELLWFNGDIEKVNCDPPDIQPTGPAFEAYLRRFPRLHDGTTSVTGEFSATYFHCWCCPRAMERLMPALRLVTQLRDPIERAKSRWKEQYNFGVHRVVWPMYDSFEEYVDKELPHLEACLRNASESLEEQVHCAAASNILGLSLYDMAIRLWHKHFDPSSFLVTFLEQMAVSPQSVATAIHKHLGISDLQYSEDLLSKKWNTEHGYGWEVSQPKAKNGSGSLERLYLFYRPHMQELKKIADAGLISPLPASWVARWSL